MFSKQQERTNKLRKPVDSWRFQRIILINLRQGEGGSAHVLLLPPTVTSSTYQHQSQQKLIQLTHHVSRNPINQ